MNDTQVSDTALQRADDLLRDEDLRMAIEMRQQEEKRVTYTPIGSKDEITLSMGMAMRTFAKPTKRGVMPSRQDVQDFLMKCRAGRLDPWVGDAFLVGYDDYRGKEWQGTATFSTIIAYQALAKRAEKHPEYDGIDFGLIVDRDGESVEVPGCFHRLDEAILGAWCKVYRRDRGRPIYQRVNLATFEGTNQFWKGKRPLMIAKCCKASALRDAFPAELSDMYISEEMPEPDTPVQIPISREDTEAPTVTAEDLTRVPGPEDHGAKMWGELKLELQRCTSVDDVNAVRAKYEPDCKAPDDFDALMLACDQQIHRLSQPANTQSEMFSGSDMTGDAAAEV